jgi:Tfp pilus assembly protein PilF
MQVLQRMVQREPSVARLRVALADLYFQAEAFGQAREHYEAAVQLGHETAPEWLKLAASYERTGDGRNAIRAYERTLAIDPSQYQVWNVLAKLLAQSGDMRGAERALERALQVKPDYEAAKKNLEAIRASRRP